MKIPAKTALQPAPLALFAVLACVTGCTPKPPAGQPRVLQDIELPVATLAQRYELSVLPMVAGHVLVEVSQENVDVQLELSGPGAITGTFDAPARR